MDDAHRGKTRPLLIAAALGAVLALAAAGYALGRGSVPGEEEAARARAEARQTAAATKRQAAFSEGHQAGMAKGRDEARATARRRGAAAGADQARVVMERRARERRVRAAALARAQESRQQEGRQQESRQSARRPSPAGRDTVLLPHGRPGYALPPSQRSRGCVGTDAETGECVGD